MKKIILFILSFGLFMFSCLAQQNKIDSLLTFIKTDKPDTTKLLHLNKLSWEYNKIGTYDSALFYANSALQLSSTILDKATDLKIKQATQKGEAISYNNIGTIYSNEGNYPEALKNYFASLKIKEALGNKTGIADSYCGIGIVYYDQGNYPEALKNYFTCLKIYESLDDKKDVAASYNGIGSVYFSQGNYPEALKNYFACLKIEEVIGEKQDIATSYNNIGIVYFSQNNYSEALKNYFASLKMRLEIGDKQGIAASYNNIGSVYFSQDNYPEALKNYLSSLKISEAIGDKAGVAGSYSNIGMVFTKQKKYKEAEEYLIKAKELSEKIGYKEYLKVAYIGLTELDSAKGNFKGAYENHKLYILYRDSLDNEETRRRTIQSQMTFDFEKKEAVADAEHKKELENQHALAEEKSRKQRAVIVFFLIGLLLVIVFAGFIFRSLHVTRKQKNIIEQQKQEVEHQKNLVEEHQKEIIDSITYAKRLQQAILPSDEEIKKYLPDSFILYKPKDIVAGDFYWLHVSDLQSEGVTVFIAVADSTGHGVPGAMVSLVCSNALNRSVNEFNLTDTGKILDKTRELVLETFAKSGEEIKDGMDISLLSLKFERSKLVGIQWSGANNPLWYLKDHANQLDNAEPGNTVFYEIKPDKQSIGKTENPKPFTTHTIELKSGTVFYLFTDGYTDQFGGEKGKKYKHKQLQQVLLNIGTLPLSEQRIHLDKHFRDWKGSLEQVDDITVVGIKI